MPAAIDESIKRKVIQQWISGESRDKIAEDNNIGAGTVSSIVDNYKIGLDNLDFGSFRELIVEAKKRAMTPRDLASLTRLYNYFKSSGANENEIESFIAKVHSSGMPEEKVIGYVYQLHEISKAESIPLDQIPSYIERKLEEKQKIDEEIKQADALLQNKNVSIEAINEHIQLNEGHPSERVVECVNQLYHISKSQSIPTHEVPKYIEKKLEEKKKIDQEIEQANDVLQSKNIDIESINEYSELNQKLKEHNLSFQDIGKLLKILVNAERYGFDGKRIASKLYDIQDLERKERGLKNKCKELSKQAAKYKDILPLTEEIAAWGIGIDELIALKVGIIQAAKHYNLPPLATTLRLIDDIKEYNKINGLKQELSALYLQKYTIDQGCTRQSQSLVNLAKLKSYGLTEDRILQLSNFLEDNAFKASSYTSTK